MIHVSPDNIRDFLEAHEEEFKELLIRMVAIESPSRVGAAQKPVLDLIEKELSKCDYYVFRSPGYHSGGFLYARPNKRTKKMRSIQLLVGHCDTVWPLGTLSKMPISEHNGTIKGPGIYDMKAGLCQILAVVRLLYELKLEPYYLPVVLINSDEEIGSHESTVIIRRLSRISDRAFVLEPPLGLDGKLKTARKGLGRYTLHVKGISAHAGLDPGKGASAIVELSRQIQCLFEMNDPVNGISVNVGMIQGGISANVVAPESSAVIDVRVLSRKDAEMIDERIMSLKAVDKQTELTIEGYFGRPPMERTKRNQKLWNIAKNIGKNIGLKLQQAVAGGGSDGNTCSQFTATLDGLGTPGDGAHALHEHILASQFKERCLLLSLLLMAEPANQMR
jgi:glutamate carboxypeptidase